MINYDWNHGRLTELILKEYEIWNYGYIAPKLERTSAAEPASYCPFIQLSMGQKLLSLALGLALESTSNESPKGVNQK